MSQTLDDRQVELFAHLARRDNYDPNNHISIDQQGETVMAEFRRVGRPTLKGMTYSGKKFATDW
eukprot:5849522-Heterocapsa_arctica.AAC.1